MTKTRAQRIEAIELQIGELIQGQKEVKTQIDGLSQKIVESVCKRMEELFQAYANGGGQEGVSLHSTPTIHSASHSSQHTTKYLPKHPHYNKRNRPPYHKIPKFDEQAKQRQLKGILDKLTPQNFERLLQQVKQLNIDNDITISGLLSLIFDKALMEPTFCEMYANFCFHLAAYLPDLSVDDEKITFKRLLLNKCQEEFERGEREEEEANKAEEEGEVKQTAEEREDKRLKGRRRMLGNIRLIGELYKKRFLTERIMHECINKLLGKYQNRDENIEALCKLMSTIGEMIDHPKAKEHIDAYFEIMTQLSNDMKLSSRVRFMLKDAIDLRENKWQQRRKVEGPKKIEEVHRDAAEERQAQSSRLSCAPSMGNYARRGPPMEYAPRSPNMLSSPSPQSGGYHCFERSLPDQSPDSGGSPTSTQNARHESLRAAPAMPIPSIPKQHMPRKDAGILDQPNAGEAQLISKSKREPQVSVALSQKPALQMRQSSKFPPQMGPQIPPQLGNMGMNMAPQFPQQPAVNYSGSRKPVKIIHPETHEELRLVSSPAPRSHPNVQSQSQPISSFPPNRPMNFFPSSYNGSSIFPPVASSVPLNSAQVPPTSQPPRLYNQVTVKPHAGSHGDNMPPTGSLSRSQDSVFPDKETDPSSLSSSQQPKPDLGNSGQQDQKIVESVCERMEELFQAYANGGGQEGLSLHSTPTIHSASHSSQHTTKYLPKYPHYNKRNRPPYHKIPKFDEQDKQRQLKGILDKLTPQNFERLLQEVKQLNIDNVIALSGLVSLTFDKALMEPTFCEMYANFCFHLAAYLPDLSVDNEKITFKRLLLNKCQEEFERGEREEEEANKAEEEGEVKQTAEEREDKRLKARRRMLGNIRLIGELYKKRFLTETIMHECINKLLGKYQNCDENIEALCKLMITIGEMIDHPKAKDQIDAYFKIMTQLSNDMKFSSRVRFMLKDAIDLRENKWQKKRKVEGPKKIEEVHRYAAQERQAQSSRLSCAPSMGNSARRVQPMEYAPRSPNMLSSQSGGYHCFERSLPDQSPDRGGSPTSTQNVSSDKLWPEERLRYQSLAAIREFYSARDEKEVALCVKDWNNPSFYPSMISLWITDSFERKEDMEREILTKLLINLTKTRYGILSRDQLIKGFESVLAVLEDAVIDAPKAAEFLGRIFAQVILENVVSLSEIGRLIYEGGEEQGNLVEIGLAAEVLGCTLEIIKSETGDSLLNEICSNSNLQLENFRPAGSKRSSRIDKFIYEDTDASLDLVNYNL